MTELYLFPHSHYCEAARWALDLKGVDYKETAIMPGPHLVLIPRIAPKSSLPVLLADNQVIQGAREIMDYLDAKHPEPQLAPLGEKAQREAAELEAAADANIGIPLRAVIYQRLIHHKGAMKHCFTYGMGLAQEAAVLIELPDPEEPDPRHLRARRGLHRALQAKARRANRGASTSA